MPERVNELDRLLGLAALGNAMGADPRSFAKVATPESCQPASSFGQKIGNTLWKCEICQKPLDDYEPEYCCSGLSNDCYCLGHPINPPVCSQACYDAMMSGIGKPMEDRRVDAGIPVYSQSRMPAGDGSAMLFYLSNQEAGMT